MSLEQQQKLTKESQPKAETKDKPPEPTAPDRQNPTQEIGGSNGPEPTRYGDWEKNGRCIDF